MRSREREGEGKVTNNQAKRKEKSEMRANKFRNKFPNFILLTKYSDLRRVLITYMLYCTSTHMYISMRLQTEIRKDM